jgi:RinA family phage transcriptional activator
VEEVGMRIEKSIFRYIEHEMYCYKLTKRELNVYRENIIEGTSKPEEGSNRGSGISDPTGAKSIKLASSIFLAKAERTLNAIDKSLDILGDKHKELFKLRYLEGRPWREVYLEMNISDRSYFRLRRELVISVGLNLGLLREDEE